MGRILIIVLGLIAAFLAVPAASWAGGDTWLSLTASSVAFTLMGVNLVLAMRLKPVEALFGGLDRLYAAHKWTGITIFVLILVHYFVKPNFKGLALSTAANIAAANAGQIAFYALVVLLLISFVKRIPKVPFEIPYGIWRFTHRFVGLFFIFIAFHQAFIKRPYDGAEWLSSWLNLWALIGIAAYLYTLVAPLLRRRRYEITEVEAHPFATLIRAKPYGRGIGLKPGQFAFISVLGNKGLGEPHPFTVSGRDEDGSIHFAIRPLGDFTKRLRERIAVGDDVLISGGHGGFVTTRGKDRQVWLAGGIGITPFLAFARNMPAQKDGRHYHLIHCVGDEGQAVGVEAFRSLAEQRPDFTFTLHSSANGNRLTAEKVRDYLPFEANGAELWFCGPPPLRVAIEKGFADLGVRLGGVEFERFEFR